MQYQIPVPNGKSINVRFCREANGAMSVYYTHPNERDEWLMNIEPLETNDLSDDIRLIRQRLEMLEHEINKTQSNLESKFNGVQTIDYIEIANNIDLPMLADAIDYAGLSADLNYARLACNLSIDMKQLAGEFDLDELSKKVDLGLLAYELNIRDIAGEIDISAIAGEMDIRAIVDEIPLSRLADKIDLDELFNRIDLEKLAQIAKRTLPGVDFQEEVRAAFTGFMREKFL